MTLPNTFGVGVGMIDKAALDANFTAVTSGTSSTPTNNVTAHAGGGQVSATVIPTGTTYVRVTTCATGGDSINLPLAAGQRVIIANKGAASMNIFASLLGTDTINGTAGTTAYALAAGKLVEFVSVGAGVWDTLLSA